MSNLPKGRSALTRLALAVFRAHQAFVADGDQFSGEWRLNSAKWKTLGAIALAGGPITGPDIGRSMSLSRQGAQKQLDVLMKQGLVTRLENPAGGRAPLYQLTAKGTRIYEQLSDAWRIRSERLAAGLDDAALQSAAQTLLEVVDAIGKNPQSRPKRKSSPPAF